LAGTVSGGAAEVAFVADSGLDHGGLENG
jgi:hypothetical protein